MCFFFGDMRLKKKSRFFVEIICIFLLWDSYYNYLINYGWLKICCFFEKTSFYPIFIIRLSIISEFQQKHYLWIPSEQYNCSNAYKTVYDNYLRNYGWLKIYYFFENHFFITSSRYHTIVNINEFHKIWYLWIPSESIQSSGHVYNLIPQLFNKLWTTLP